jgi:hypothetical protein
MAERVFDWSGLTVTHLRPTFFAEWFLYYAVFYSPVRGDKFGISI